MQKKKNNKRIQLKEQFKTFARSESAGLNIETSSQFINNKHFKHQAVKVAFILLNEVRCFVRCFVYLKKMNEYGIFPNLFLHIFDVRNQSIQKKNKATSRLMFLIMALYTRENKPRLIFSPVIGTNELQNSFLLFFFHSALCKDQCLIQGFSDILFCKLTS